MKVMKFGGSCLQSRDGVLRMLELVRAEPRPLVIVLSALKGVTDWLIELLDQAARGVAPDLAPFRARHDEVLEPLRGAARADAEAGAGALLDELGRVLRGVAALGEVPDSTRDRVLSFGERLSVVLAAGHFAEAGLPARLGGERAILTTDEAGDARILPASDDLVRRAFPPGDDVVHVVAGFVGLDAKGRFTTLGRGGSDTTATYLASVLGGPAILWKDTQGLLTGDPKVVAAPRVIERIHYLDALELAHYGLKAVAERSIHPALRSGVPIEIRSFADGEAPSLIGDVPSTRLAISYVREVVMLDLLDLGADQAPRPDEPAEPVRGRVLHALARLLDGLASAGVVPLLLTEASPSGETTVALKADARGAVERVLERWTARGLESRLRAGFSAVSLIGSGMRGMVGFAASVFSCLAAEGVNIHVIAQTNSERNISVIVDAAQAQAAVRALHRRFVEDAPAR